MYTVFIDEVNTSGLRPALVVLDTLGTCLSGADENNNGQMREVLDGAEEIGSAWDAAVLLIHHTGKVGKSPRGAQALQDGVAMHAHLNGDGEHIRCALSVQSRRTQSHSSRYAVNYTRSRWQRRSISELCGRLPDWPARSDATACTVGGGPNVCCKGFGIPMTPALVAKALTWNRRAAGEALRRQWIGAKCGSQRETGHMRL